MISNGKNLTLHPRKPEGVVDANGVTTQKSLFSSVDIENLAAISLYVQENSAEAGHAEDGKAIAVTLESIMTRIAKLLPDWELQKVKLLASDGT